MTAGARRAPGSGTTTIDQPWRLHFDSSGSTGTSGERTGGIVRAAGRVGQLQSQGVKWRELDAPQLLAGLVERARASCAPRRRCRAPTSAAPSPFGVDVARPPDSERSRSRVPFGARRPRRRARGRRSRRAPSVPTSKLEEVLDVGDDRLGELDARWRRPPTASSTENSAAQCRRSTAGSSPGIAAEPSSPTRELGRAHVEGRSIGARRRRRASFIVGGRCPARTAPSRCRVPSGSVIVAAARGLERDVRAEVDVE